MCYLPKGLWSRLWIISFLYMRLHSLEGPSLGDVPRCPGDGCGLGHICYIKVLQLHAFLLRSALVMINFDVTAVWIDYCKVLYVRLPHVSWLVSGSITISITLVANPLPGESLNSLGCRHLKAHLYPHETTFHLRSSRGILHHQWKVNWW